jgi:dTDP-4-dehydrorhamnose 3,5-epimerase
VLDVAVDLRRGSPTYGQHVACELSTEAWNQIYVPTGFAHGFCTLTPDAEVLYKVTDYYEPTADRSIRWNDPELAIDWPYDPAQVTLSDKDRRAPTLAEFEARS